jgi:class 3 adenylate cyclase
MDGNYLTKKAVKRMEQKDLISTDQKEKFFISGKNEENKNLFTKIKSYNLNRKWFIPFVIGVFCCGIIHLASFTKVIKDLEFSSYDWRIINRHNPIFAKIQAHSHFRNPNITVIPVNNKTLQKFPEPILFWTPYYAEVFNYLVKNGATVVAVDYLFPISSDSFLKDTMSKYLTDLVKEGKIKLNTPNIEEMLNSLPSYDKQFFESLRSRKIILIAAINESGEAVLPYYPFRFAAPENIGLATCQPDADGVIRRQFLYKTSMTPQKKEEEFFTLDLVTASKFLDKPIKLNEKLNKLCLGDTILPHNKKDWALQINYIAPPNTYTNGYAFHDLVEKAKKGDNKFFRENFKGKAVLIGPAYTGSLDLALTPYHLGNSLEMYGIEVHANMLNTILNQDFINQVPRRTIGFILIIFGLLIAFAAYYLKPVPSAMVGLIISLAYLCLSFFILYRYNYWMNMVVPLMVIPLAYSATYVYRYVVEDKEKRHIRKVLGRYVSEDVAQEILKDPHNLDLGGERADVSILFCDINDFTTYSEITPPEEVISILNDYFTRMEQVIFKNRGTLKQFIGDEIMVICGVPQRDSEHATRICAIAIEMLEELRKWQKQRQEAGKFVFDVKFGIHSGEVVAGNVGSLNRTEYTTIGDVVNTTSRIMGLTKKVNAHILISESTYQRVKEHFQINDKGSHPVKGRKEEVRVYELVGKS